MSTVQVKICGLMRRPDAELAAASGADYGGVILAPGGTRSITAAAAACLFDGLPLIRVGVFVNPEPRALRSAAETASLDVVQLHGSETPAMTARLRDAGRWQVWKALRPRNAAVFLDDLARYAGAVDGILLDGWSAQAPGGTGSRFPWEQVANHRQELPESLRLVVAGGLTPANVRAVIGLLDPAVVDVSSGVEDSPGVKNSAAISAFVVAAREAAVDPLSES